MLRTLKEPSTEKTEEKKHVVAEKSMSLQKNSLTLMDKESIIKNHFL